MKQRIKELLGLAGHPAEQDRKITKKALCSHESCTPADKRLVEDVVEAAWLIGIINDDTAHVPTFIDDERRYEEAHVLLVEIGNRAKSKRIGDLLDALIPNPTIMVMAHEGAVQVQVGRKRMALNDSNKVVVEARWATPWLPAEDSSWVGFSVRDWSHANMLSFMADAERAVLAKALSEAVGRPVASAGLDPSRAATTMEDILQTKDEIRHLEAEKRDTKHFGEKTALHLKIKAAERRLASLVDALS